MLEEDWDRRDRREEAGTSTHSVGSSKGGSSVETAGVEGWEEREAARRREERRTGGEEPGFAERCGVEAIVS